MTKLEMKNSLKKNPSNIYLILSETSKEIKVETIISVPLFLENELSDLRKLKQFYFEENKCEFYIDDNKYIVECF